MSFDQWIASYLSIILSITLFLVLQYWQLLWSFFFFFFWALHQSRASQSVDSQLAELREKLLSVPALVESTARTRWVISDLSSCYSRDYSSTTWGEDNCSHLKMFDRNCHVQYMCEWHREVTRDGHTTMKDAICKRDCLGWRIHGFLFRLRCRRQSCHWTVTCVYLNFTDSTAKQKRCNTGYFVFVVHVYQ